MQEIVCTISRNGRVIIPAEIRQRLGIELGGKLFFIIESEGVEGKERILLKAPRYPNIASLRGAAGSLIEPLPWNEMSAIAYDDRISETSDPLS